MGILSILSCCCKAAKTADIPDSGKDTKQKVTEYFDKQHKFLTKGKNLSDSSPAANNLSKGLKENTLNCASCILSHGSFTNGAC